MIGEIEVAGERVFEKQVFLVDFGGDDVGVVDVVGVLVGGVDEYFEIGVESLAVLLFGGVVVVEHAGVYLQVVHFQRVAQSTPRLHFHVRRVAHQARPH